MKEKNYFCISSNISIQNSNIIKKFTCHEINNCFDVADNVLAVSIFAKEKSANFRFCQLESYRESLD